MSSNFDWRAEDDHRWDEYTAPERGDDGKPPRGRPPTFIIILGVLVVIIGVGTLVYMQLRRYVETTAVSVEEDVLSSHALVKVAAVEDDLELLAPLLSGRDPGWTQAQLTLLDMNLLLDRRPFGLTWMPQETADNIEIELSPDLQSAEVEFTETYGYGVNGEEGQVELVQTAVYRLSETRWLLSPPADDFWGNWISSRGRYVVLTYPERDEELGARLASDIEATLAGACLNLVLECENAPPLEVLLATDLEAMMEANDPDYFAADVEDFVLPAPTLVGKPATSAGYRLLNRAYSTILVARLIARQVGWECCDHSAFFKAMVDVQLDQLSLQRWPITAETYAFALRDPVTLAIIREFWDDDLTLSEIHERPDWWMLYSFIEFLNVRGTEDGILDAQAAMVVSDSFKEWLSEMSITGSLNLVVDDWRDYSLERINQTQWPPPLAWPEEDIALMCYDDQFGRVSLFRYDLSENSWGIEIGNRNFVVMSGLPNNSGLILTEQFLDVDLLRTTLWRDGLETLVSFGEDFYYSAEVSNPEGNYLVINRFIQASLLSGDFESGNFLLDLDNCDAEGCNLIPLSATGTPLWSPDGSRTLWAAMEANLSTGGQAIYVGDSTGQSAELVGGGYQPFWLDNENIAFLDDPNHPVLIQVNIDDFSTKQILEAADFVPFLPDVEQINIKIRQAVTDPIQPDLIYLTIANRTGYENYVFSFNLQTAEIKLLFTIEEAFGGLNYHSFSPNHNWIILNTNLVDTNNSSARSEYVYLLNVETNVQFQYKLINDTLLPTHVWSNDGRWLVFIGRGFLVLSAPEAGYDYLVPHTFRDCTAAAWIE